MKGMLNQTPEQRLWKDSLAVIYNNKGINLELPSKETMSYVVCNVLSDREKFILQKYYWSNCTLKEIGTMIGVNSERVRQIKLKSLRKIFLGVQKLHSKPNNILNADIADLGLSKRLYYVLRRAGYTKVRDLTNSSIEELTVKVRNFGPKAEAELVTVTEKFGISLKRRSEKENEGR